MIFSASYMKAQVRCVKIYIPMIKRGIKGRISKAGSYKTATRALKYAERWADRANGIINITEAA
jgi:hypothetical protein